MPWWYFAIAMLLGVAIGLWQKRWKAGVLVAYMVVLFSSMVLNRRTLSTARTWLFPFDSYTNRPIVETASNILAFIPIGLLAGERWRGILVGIGFSLLTEISQYISHKGFLEPDDVFFLPHGIANPVCSL